jgi:hydroxylamine reductase
MQGGADLITGCAHDAVLALLDKVVAAVRSGDIKRFIVMARCDGRQKDRDYYTKFARALPRDTVILTAGCAKYRYAHLNLGTIRWYPTGTRCRAVQ